MSHNFRKGSYTESIQSFVHCKTIMILQLLINAKLNHITQELQTSTEARLLSLKNINFFMSLYYMESNDFRKIIRFRKSAVSVDRISVCNVTEKKGKA